MSQRKRKIATDCPADARYYSQLVRRRRTFAVDLDKDPWFDMWHQHFDLHGYGDHGWRDRRRHLSALLEALSRAVVQLSALGKPYQAFAVVNPGASSEDALYIHTPNPNGTDFPLSHQGRDLQHLPSLLAGKIDLRRYRVLTSEADPTTYVIERREQDA
jgi:hypothetical protein